MRNPLNVMRIRGTSNNNKPLHNTFGMVRKHANGTPKPHQGWDLEAHDGTAIYAIAQGHVVSVLNQGDYGRQVILAFGWRGATRYAHYAHLSSTAVVQGQEVLEGTILGRTGHSGNAAGLPVAEHHLHFEIRTKHWPGPHLYDRVDPGDVLGFETLSSFDA